MLSCRKILELFTAIRSALLRLDYCSSTIFSRDCTLVLVNVFIVCLHFIVRRFTSLITVTSDWKFFFSKAIVQIPLLFSIFGSICGWFHLIKVDSIKNTANNWKRIPFFIDLLIDKYCRKNNQKCSWFEVNFQFSAERLKVCQEFDSFFPCSPVSPSNLAFHCSTIFGRKEFNIILI